MKKIIALLLVLATVFVLAACGKKDSGKQDPTPASALEVLEKVWVTYAENEKFYAMGGDFNEPLENAPGKFSLEDSEAVTASLAVPADQQKNIDQAASLTHGMMVNNFTCGVFHMAQGADAKAFADAMHAAIGSNQWICGAPEQMLIAIIGGEYVLSAFGSSELIKTFQNRLAGVYPNADIRYQDAITG